MNWYKKAYKITNHQDRNRINKRIREFKEIGVVLDYFVDLVHQNTKGVIEGLQNIANEKKMTSYPDIKDMLSEAIAVGYDNKDKASELIQAAKDEVVKAVVKLESERAEYVNKTLPDRLKAKWSKDD